MNMISNDGSNKLSSSRKGGESSRAMPLEGWPGVVRAEWGPGLNRRDPEKDFNFVGPMFRRERPQRGRVRQCGQLRVEIFCRSDAAIDAELMVMVNELQREL